MGFILSDLEWTRFKIKPDTFPVSSFRRLFQRSGVKGMSNTRCSVKHYLLTWAISIYVYALNIL